MLDFMVFLLFDSGLNEVYVKKHDGALSKNVFNLMGLNQLEPF